MNPTLTAELRKLRASRTTTATALVVAGVPSATSRVRTRSKAPATKPSSLTRLSSPAQHRAP